MNKDDGFLHTTLKVRDKNDQDLFHTKYYLEECPQTIVKTQGTSQKPRKGRVQESEEEEGSPVP